MKTIGQIIRANREESGLLLRQLAAKLDIDAAILSKIERNERKPTREIILKIAEIFSIEEEEIMAQFISDKIAYEYANEDCVIKSLRLAEQKIKYIKSGKNGKI